ADGLPMPGVTVLDKTNQTGTTTNIDGEYSLSVGSNSVVIFSFIGYAAQEGTVGNQTEINITLIEDASELSGVVVTAFGMDKAQKSLGYATSTIKADELVKTGTPNVASALYGKAAGVKIQTGAGGATSAVNIQ